MKTPDQRRIVLATQNAHKSTELQAMLAPTGVEVVPLSLFTLESPAETGTTFVENALIKARYASQVSALPAIADDSGIAVDALRGEPGVHSARYAGEHATDDSNVEKLLSALRDVPDHARTARYHCALVFMRHPLDPVPILCHATWEGCVTRARRGTGGFGYDPIFQLQDRDVTAAEISATEKNSVSHRGRALRQLLEALRSEWRIA